MYPFLVVVVFESVVAVETRTTLLDPFFFAFGSNSASSTAAAIGASDNFMMLLLRVRKYKEKKCMEGKEMRLERISHRNNINNGKTNE